MDCARRARPRIRAARPCVARRVDDKGGLAVAPSPFPRPLRIVSKGIMDSYCTVFLPQSVFIASRHFYCVRPQPGQLLVKLLGVLHMAGAAAAVESAPCRSLFCAGFSRLVWLDQYDVLLKPHYRQLQMNP